MKIAEALSEAHRREKANDTPNSRVVGLEQYMRHQYTKRYIALCRRCGVAPVSFGQWLLRDVSTI